MLKRISTIKNVGSFKDCNGRQAQFDKITLIYGRNTYGKTTLGSILSSLKCNNPEIVLARRSIPLDNSPLEIDLSFENPAGGRELAASYRNDRWTNALPADYRLAVYDDGFYHQNVFLGRTLTRDTREGFNDFILGAQGVGQAEVISAKNKELGDAKRQAKQLEEGVFAGIDNLDDFIALDLVEDIEEERKQLSEARQAYAELKRQEKESTSIKARKNLAPLRLDTSFQTAVQAINSILEQGLENAHEAAKTELGNHIATHFAKPDGAEQWIQQGLGYLKDDNCSFCGQQLAPEVNELLELYRQCFDDQFDRHQGLVTSTIDRHQDSLNTRWIESIETSIEKAELVLQAYPELALDEDTRAVIDRITSEHSNIVGLLPDLKIAVELLTDQLKTFIGIKKLGPMSIVPAAEVKDVEEFLALLAHHIGEVSGQYSEFNRQAIVFKSRFEDAQIAEDLERLESEGKVLGRAVKRYDKEAQSQEYQEIKSTIRTLGLEIPQLKQALQSEQAAYLGTYFTAINRYFRYLGSRDYTLELRTETRGHKPINSFKVKFHNEVIDDNDLDKIFSESDRRSLGLSVFLASLDALPTAELEKTIIILDDPVTSFDEGRVGQTHTKLVNFSSRCAQVILLSHFKDGVANFLKVHGFSSNNNIALIEIDKQGGGSVLKNGNKDVFVKTAHNLNSEELIDFVERRTEKLNCKPRVYLEEVLDLRFTKQMHEKGISHDSLNNRIVGLLEHNIISNDIAQSLDAWRTELNPEHHVWVGDDVENQRTTIANLLDFIFHDLAAEPMEVA